MNSCNTTRGHWMNLWPLRLGLSDKGFGWGWGRFQSGSREKKTDEKFLEKNCLCYTTIVHWMNLWPLRLGLSDTGFGWGWGRGRFKSGSREKKLMKSLNFKKMLNVLMLTNHTLSHQAVNDESEMRWRYGRWWEWNKTKMICIWLCS